MRVAIVAIALKFIGLIFEGAGFAMLLPIMEYIGSGYDLEALQQKSQLWAKVVPYVTEVGIPINLMSMFIVCFVCILLRQIFQFLQTAYEIRKRLNLNRHMQVLGFERAIKARIGYHDQSLSGDFINDMNVELVTATSSIFGVIVILGVFLHLMVYAGAMVMISMWLSLSLAIISVVLFLLMKRLMSRSRDISHKITRTNQNIMSFLVERMHLVRMVRLSGTEENEIENMRRKARTLNDDIQMSQLINASIPAIFEPLAFLAIFSLILVGIYQLGMEIELVLMFTAAAMRALPLLRQLSMNYQGLLKMSGSIITIIDRMRELAREREFSGGKNSFTGLKRDIRFEHVTFDYGLGADSPALKDISLEIPAGKITALVGPSGSGKSTLIDLLPVLRRPREGKILFDGVSAEDFTVKSLRAGIAFVPQSPQVFNESAREHILYGNPNASEGEVREMASMAGAVDFIEAMSEGYDTLLGEGGVCLSGGERQRLDLARALVRKGSVLILDEPASGLDADAEEKFRLALFRIRKETGMTVILIAHGFSTVVDADQIIVLKQGKVVDSGTHDSLMREEGWYAQAFNKQHRVALNGPASAAEG